jgi:murein DD-endopeptidase MepM/ murein hydrolase activator NlpD
VASSNEPALLADSGSGHPHHPEQHPAYAAYGYQQQPAYQASADTAYGYGGQAAQEYATQAHPAQSYAAQPYANEPYATHGYAAPAAQGYAAQAAPAEWDTGEWNAAAGWVPGAEQAPPTPGRYPEWDTGEWNAAAGWTRADEPGAHPGADADADAGRVNADFDAALDADLGGGDLGGADLGGTGYEDGGFDGFGGGGTGFEDARAGADETAADAGAAHETAGDDDSAAGEGDLDEQALALRGRHRVAKQRSLGRGSAVLGVAALAVVGVGGVATAEGHSPVPVSLPHEVSDVPVIGGLLDGGPKPAGSTASQSGTAATATTASTTSAGEALRNRILGQAQQQKDVVDRADATQDAKEAAAAKVRAAAAARKKAAEKAKKAALAASYVKPVASYTLTASFGETSPLWQTVHTGQDFAAPTGTPVKAIHGGTVTSAGWAGSYGYRIILTLGDGTQLWFCHLSSMIVTSGKVTTGETIGRVGATGNTTGPHLHLEVRPHGGEPIDPMPWLRAHGLDV